MVNEIILYYDTRSKKHQITKCCWVHSSTKDWQHYWKIFLLLPLFPFVPATSINLLRLLDPVGEGSVTFGKVNNYLPAKKAWRLTSSATSLRKSQHISAFRIQSLKMSTPLYNIHVYTLYSWLWTTFKWLCCTENHSQKRDRFLEYLWSGNAYHF